ncbi:hypothetical protein HDU93_004590 [Gonapodya sp. JEL0774]|nr:hypothetical protein HDU93_004590 [Gonapodya sp. JEL0774]
MDGLGSKADSELLHQLFRENNELRAQFNVLSRELYNKSVLYDDTLEELRVLKQKLEQQGSTDQARPITSASYLGAMVNATPNIVASKLVKGMVETCEKPSKRPTSTSANSNLGLASLSKQLEEALLILDRRNNEISQLRDELDASKAVVLQHQLNSDQAEREIRDLEEQVATLKREQGEMMVIRAMNETESEEDEMFVGQNGEHRDSVGIVHKKKLLKSKPQSDDQAAALTKLRAELSESEETIRILRKQVVEVVSDANTRHNELQGELQGMEAVRRSLLYHSLGFSLRTTTMFTIFIKLIDSVRNDYAAFINTTRLEHETYKSTQAAQYAGLKSQLEAHRAADFAERKRLTKEYEGVLYSIQAEFEEYRTISEFLFNTEIAKLEEEISSQASRYEQEILYVIQAKDKFYADMMVAKDAKIMNLIEGSDLQTLMQKHEVDMDNLRRDHIRELERLKSDQESEAKSLIQLLQRQNSSLENKCEKLQAHIKNLETRIKESQNLLEIKAKHFAEREENWVKREREYEGKVSELLERNIALVREKEHLRHKVIRLNLDAKGEAGNGIDSMLKRISRDTIDLQSQYTELSIKYEDATKELLDVSKKVKEKERFITYLEKEVARRNDEYVNMTQTFEHFLSSRARAARRDRAKHLQALQHSNHSAASSTRETLYPGPGQTSPLTNVVRNPRDPKLDLFNQGKVVKIHVPEVSDGKSLLGPLEVSEISPTTPKFRRSSSVGNQKSMVGVSGVNGIDKKQAEVEEMERMELERGFAYLRRFKTLSRAFTTGEFRRVNYMSELDGTGVTSADAPGPWTMISLYSKLRETANHETAEGSHLYGESPQEQRFRNMTALASGAVNESNRGPQLQSHSGGKDAFGVLVKPTLYVPGEKQSRREGSAPVGFAYCGALILASS